MPDYKTMCHALFNTISTTIESLKAVQRNAEDAYVENAEPSLHIVSDASQEEKTKPAE
ncbi:MAG TPA: hypothetical protein VN366_09920 [Feifaniaceae bacterium]|nr:hypothetical protein [Feifaniaceae bacterium]